MTDRNFSNAEPPYKSVSENLYDEMRKRILEGKLKKGARLPSERRLAEDNLVSRGTVREALRLLEQTGLVIRKRGSGSYINFPQSENEANSGDVAEITSPLQLLEVRLALESQTVRLASQNMTVRDITDLENSLYEMEDAEFDKEKFSYWDKIFHLRIAEGTRNPLMIAMYGEINYVRTHDLWESIKGAILTPDRIRQYNLHHRDVFDAIRGRDPRNAATLMNKHLRLAEKDLLAPSADGSI